MSDAENAAGVPAPSSPQNQGAERTGSLRAARWLLRFNPLPNPRLRLFCFPPAGGDANIFRDWQRAVPAGVEVVGVQYPGRGRNNEELLDSCDELVAALLGLLPPSLELDFAFFGHSNGGLISFELARRLELQHRLLLRHHFISASPAPHVDAGRQRTSDLSDVEFIRRLRDMGGTPPEVLRDDKLMRMLLPRLRADFRVGEGYVFRPGARLSCDLTLLRGARDLAVDAARIAPWAELTAGTCTEHVIDGDHFFIGSHMAQVVALIGATLNEHVLKHTHPHRMVRS